MKLKIKCDIKKGRAFLKEKMSDAEQLAHTETLEYGKMFVKSAIEWTPPSGGGKNGARITGARAKKAQEERIWKDFMNPARSPFIIVDKKYTGRLVNPQEHLKKFRMRKGKKSWYLNWRGPRVAALKTSVHAEYRRRISHIGRLAAGWLEGAQVSGLKSGIPAWVKRHGTGSGKARLTSKRGAWKIIITNKIKDIYDSRQMDFIIDGLLTGAVKKKIDARKKNLRLWLIRGAKNAGKISLD